MKSKRSLMVCRLSAFCLVLILAFGGVIAKRCEANAANSHLNEVTKKNTISTPMYKIKMPKNWKGKYGYKVKNKTENGFELMLYLKDGGKNVGWLYSYVVSKDGNLGDAEYIGNYEDKGYIKKKGTSDVYRFYELHPSDVPMKPGYEDMWYELYEDRENVFSKMKLRKAYQWNK